MILLNREVDCVRQTLRLYAIGFLLAHIEAVITDGPVFSWHRIICLVFCSIVGEGEIFEGGVYGVPNADLVVVSRDEKGNNRRMLSTKRILV